MLPELQPDTQNAVAKFKRIKKEDLSNTEKILRDQLDQVSGSIFEVAKRMAQMEVGRARLDGSYLGLAKTVEAIMISKEEELKESKNDTDKPDDTFDVLGSIDSKQDNDD
ncbi:MAG: hypothetical protein KAS32_19780 [Candidatus Peribacteraceae bacterium]|nr:hypothetical protein [Candidatus Peribacteraceae bacterium]